MSRSTAEPSPTLSFKKRRLLFKPTVQDTDYDADTSASTEITDLSENTPTDLNSDDGTVDSVQCHDSRKMQARHYKTLQELWKKTRPNQQAVGHLLDLEFESRRAFIDSCSLKEEDRTETVIEAYPCFREHQHVLDEMGRILEAGNKNFTYQIKARWESFCENALFFGVWNKSLKPPMGLDKSGQAIAFMKALPSMFPSPTAPPKKLGSASEALFHVLEPSEDPNTFLQKRPITSPVILVDSTNLLLAVGKIPLMTLPKEMIHEAPLILMGCFYTFHLTYPKCVATLLSVIQTEVLKDIL
ncbi:uncharacterized protein LOC117538312 [Gymnodraco acuticeps]|uniref:Uncharacterized protein LOC117538312 n=1 Tax=Gymnodraco acuticeps TaxID=8218 RepID=A0A6P8T815_GYMAC|nr:uncharacterized protein LOC117538312 [Gymnodraco acuticeps]